jgi:glycosyltransferase involved in cell wall biosynthesis
MKIAIVHKNWGAGAARCAKDLQKELSARHEVFYFPRCAEETSRSILEELDRVRPDVVHCHSFYGNLPYDFLAEVSNRFRTCFTVHDPRPIGTIQLPCWECTHNDTCRRCPMIGSTWRQYLRNPYFAQRKLKREVHLRCGSAMRIVAPSLWMAHRLKVQELRRFQIRHIPYGIDLERFSRTACNRALFGLPAKQPVVLFSAWYETKRSVGVRKGIADLAAAFIEHVVPAHPEAVLAVAGESFVPNHPNVRPLGLIDLDRLPQLLSTCDLYVLPTLADNLPYTILEAMGCGLPIVATTVGGIPEQVVDGQTGLLVSPGNPAELGAAIVRMLADPAAAKNMGMRGRARAEELFSMGRFVAEHEALLSELALTEPKSSDASHL